MLALQVRRAFQRHRPADVGVGGLDLGFAEAEPAEQVETRLLELFGGNLQRPRQEIRAERPLVEDEFDVERGSPARASSLAITASVKPLRAQRRDVDARRLAERAVTGGVGLDLGDRRFAIAERTQRFRHGAVDDLEIAAAGELLELHQREIRLDAGRVAIHHEADRAGRRDDGDLRVAVAVLLSELQRVAPRRPRGLGEPRPGAARPCRSRHGRAASARRSALHSRPPAPRRRARGCG